MKVTVYTKQIVKDVVEVPDEFAVLLDDEWIDNNFDESIKLQNELQDTVWSLVSKDAKAIICICDEDDKNALFEM